MTAFAYAIHAGFGSLLTRYLLASCPPKMAPLKRPASALMALDDDQVGRGRGRGRAKGRGNGRCDSYEAIPDAESADYQFPMAQSIENQLPDNVVSPKRPAVAVEKPLAVAQAPQMKMRVKYVANIRDSPQLGTGLVALRRANKLCDTTVMATSGARIAVHGVVLAAHSELLRNKLNEAGSVIELEFASYEAVDLFVRWAYGEIDAKAYEPSSPKVNEEVLQISSDLQMSQLSELCAMRMADGVDTGNVVDRIRICEDFGLPKLRAALIAGIIKETRVLNSVAQNPATLKHPALMRELLSAIAQKVAE